MALNLEKSAKELDNALEKETPESLTQYLNEKRNSEKKGYCYECMGDLYPGGKCVCKEFIH